MPEGIDTRRIADVRVTRAGDQTPVIGSAYRVTDQALLTAAHVVRDAAVVRLRFNADEGELEWTAEADVEWSDHNADIAILTIRPVDHTGNKTTLFGTVGRVDAVIPFSSVGFPRFKLRETDGDPGAAFYRDRHHAAGTIAVLSNSREGTLELTVPPPERDPTPERSPWEGMSGAPVFSGGRLVGLVAKHHRSDGLGRLAAVRIENLYNYIKDEDLARLVPLAGIPPRRIDLPDVVPRAPAALVLDDYLEALKSIAPDVLLDRHSELEKLVRFCAGSDAYQWWQAGPWVGKTALASWFALHPPIGVQVVSFFVTKRLAGQSDSTAFTEEMIEQLAALAGEVVSPAATPRARDGERRRLLKAAAQRCSELGERLLLMVDGLDEDTGIRPPGRLPSIASLLPDKPDQQVRVLVMSRPRPGLPHDVPRDHPLRECALHELLPAPITINLQDEAEEELRERLQGDTLEMTIIGLITAARGGLSVRELSELTGQPSFSLDTKLNSDFGRSLRIRFPTQGPTEALYTFGHETLREAAEVVLARDLGPYIEKIDAWAEKYSGLGWPEDCPQYVLRPYGRQVAARGDLPRFLHLATDVRRHNRLRGRSFADQAALGEIALAQDLVRRQERPDFLAMIRLAYHRDLLLNRYAAVPADLPWLWVRLGESRRGLALLASLDTSGWNHSAKRVAEALAAAGEIPEALAAVRRLSDPASRVEALTAIASSLVAVDPDRASQLLLDAKLVANSLAWPVPKARQLVDIARALRFLNPAAAREALVDAEALVNTERDDRRLRDQGVIPQAEVLCAITETYVVLGDIAEAMRVAAHMEYQRDRALEVVARGLAEHGHFSEAKQVVDQLGQGNQRALAALAEIAADAGAVEQAKRFLALVEIPRTRVGPLVALARHEGVNAAKYLSEAEHAVIAAPSDNPAPALANIIEAWAIVNRDEAERAIGGFEALIRAAVESQDPYGTGSPDSVRCWLVRSLIALGLTADAEAVIKQFDEPPPDPARLVPPGRTAMGLRATAATTIAERLERVGDHNGTDRVLLGISDAREQIEALLKVATLAADMDRSRACEFAGRIENLAAVAAETTASDHRAWWLATALAAADELQRAENVAMRIHDEGTRGHALMPIIDKLAMRGDAREVARVAAQIQDRTDRSLKLIHAAESLASGHYSDAIKLLDAAREAIAEITDWTREMRLAELGAMLAKLGMSTAASKVAEEVRDNESAFYIHLALAERSLRNGGESAIGHLSRAEQLARRSGFRGQPAGPLAKLADSFDAVDHAHAAALLTDAEAAGLAIPHLETRASELAIVAASMVKIGESDHAVSLAHLVERPFLDTPLRAVALAFASTGDIGSAEQTAREMSSVGNTVETLARIGSELVESDPGRARQLVNDAAQAESKITAEDLPTAERMALQGARKAILHAWVALHDWSAAESFARRNGVDVVSALVDDLSEEWPTISKSEQAQLRPLVDRIVTDELAGPRWKRAAKFAVVLQPAVAVGYQELLNTLDP